MQDVLWLVGTINKKGWKSGSYSQFLLIQGKRNERNGESNSSLYSTVMVSAIRGFAASAMNQTRPAEHHINRMKSLNWCISCSRQKTETSHETSI